MMSEHLNGFPDDDEMEDTEATDLPEEDDIEEGEAPPPSNAAIFDELARSDGIIVGMRRLKTEDRLAYDACVMTFRRIFNGRSVTGSEFEGLTPMAADHILMELCEHNALSASPGEPTETELTNEMRTSVSDSLRAEGSEDVMSDPANMIPLEEFDEEASLQAPRAPTFKRLTDF